MVLMNTNHGLPLEKLNDSTPTPKVLYIHDDLTAYVRQTHPADSLACRLTQELFRTVCQSPNHVIILHLEDQIRQLIDQDEHTPFALTIGIGQAGERVAAQLHERTGWFPAIQRVDITREEDGDGGYRIVSTTAMPLDLQLQSVKDPRSLAVVDDTVFSGLTMYTLLSALPTSLRRRTHAFCLRGIAESLPRLRALCPLSVGFAAAGRILEDVSFINATGLVLRVGIRRSGGPNMAFFERRSWMDAWFTDSANEVIACCRRLNALLEPPGTPSQASI